MIEKLKEGAEQWNKWREENRVAKTQLYPPKYTDLTGAQSADANLGLVSMPCVNLSDSNLLGCDLTASDLSVQIWVVLPIGCCLNIKNRFNLY
jgi:uncharacterized protein YjbI with pentapeptide repeats